MYQKQTRFHLSHATFNDSGRLSYIIASYYVGAGYGLGRHGQYRRPDRTALTRALLGLFDGAIWRTEIRARMRGGGDGIKRRRSVH